MLVRFYLHKMTSFEDWGLDAVPSVGDFVRLDSGEGWVTEVSWTLSTIDHPHQSVDVIVERVKK